MSNIQTLSQRASRWQVAAICLALAAITFAVFGQTLTHGFINYDDKEYVYNNPVVARGLTIKGIVWALTCVETDYWHPLTWLTHMANCQVFGMWAGGHHLTNVVLHAAAALFLFLALQEITGCLWRSAFVAAVFAIHPLRVESVAWVTERKDVLSGMFFMLTLWAYARYARQPSRGRHAAVAVWYGLGLLCKNTLVTLPFVLLLLDWWPLQRVKLDGAGAARPGRLFIGLIKEKIPLFLLSVGSCVATFLLPEKVSESHRLPFLERVGNAVVSYGIYLRQMFYPAGLAIPYPNPPNGQPLWEIGLALAVLAAISFCALACWKGRPYLLVGWLWYLGMLVPAIGIVQISYYAHADRYTYLPGIGLVLAGTWAVGDWSAGWKYRRALLGGLAAIVIGALMVCACQQTMYWKDSETLWTRTLACTTGNFIAHNNLGDVLLQKGETGEAITQFQKALQINPNYAEANNNIGFAFLRIGNVDEAIPHFQKALKITPSFVLAHNNLGIALLQKGRADEAITEYQNALQINPDYAASHYNLALVLLQKGRADEAIVQFQKALQSNPDNVDMHYNLATALRQKGRVAEAKVHYQKVLQIRPDFAVQFYNRGNDLRDQGKVDEAIVQYREALQINPDYADAHINLASVLLQAGRLDEAIAHGQQALQIDSNSAQAHNNLGNAFLQKGDVAEAIAHFQQAMQIEPADPWIKNNLAWLRATCGDASLRNGNEAVELATQADELSGGGKPVILGTLAAAYAEAGRFSKAVETAQQALVLARAQSKTKLAEQLQSLLKLYQAGKPFHSRAQTH